MVVYWEYSFLENFALDGLLLYLALKCAHSPVCVWRLLLAAALGGAEAVLFPLFSLPAWCAVLVKLCGGAVLVLVALPRCGAKRCFLAVCCFFLLTFALGGLLTAAYSFLHVEYAEGNGYFVEQAPVGLVLAGAGGFGVCIAKAAKKLYRFRKVERALLRCELENGERRLACRAFSDSGNCLSFRERPVCVLSPVAALALFRGGREVGRMQIKTVNGGREAPVLCCERMRVNGREFTDVYFTVGDTGKNFQVILHTAYSEGDDEAAQTAQSVAAKEGRERECRALSVRERGAAPAAPPRGRGGDAQTLGGGRGYGEHQGEAHRA